MPLPVEFFPDLAQFEPVQEPEPVQVLPSRWELIKIGTFQLQLDQLLLRRASKGPATKLRIALSELVAMANRIFGFNGWSTLVKGCCLLTENFDETTSSFSGSYEATVSLTLRDGFTIESTGRGVAHNLPLKQNYYSKCKKEAVTDATRRSLMQLGLLLVDATD